MPVIKSFRTDGDNYLRKTRTDGDFDQSGSVRHYEKQNGSDGASSNTVYTLTKDYSVGSNTLMIFVNGQKAEKVTTATDTTEYEETSVNSVTFGASLLDADVIEFIMVGNYVATDADLNAYKEKSMYGFAATLSGDQSNISEDELVTVEFDTVTAGVGSFDPEGDFDTDNYYYVIPVTGYYQFNLMVRFQNLSAAVTYCWIGVRNITDGNYTEWISDPAYPSSRSFQSPSMSCLMSCTAGDHVSALVFLEDGVADTSDIDSTYCWFSGAFIGN